MDSNLTFRLFCLPLILALLACRGESDIPASVTAVAGAAEIGNRETNRLAAETILLTIHTADGDHAFEVETAVTAEEQNRGLMFRESLPDNGGMLFLFEYPQIASFWMRNTMIPLDMIFIRANGEISNIARETIPYSLDSYQSTESVIAVLEINGGRTAALGIAEGDRVIWPGGPVLKQ